MLMVEWWVFNGSCDTKKQGGKRFDSSSTLYPDPGSNRDGLLHWCLRPARLPIPPSGQHFAYCGAKVQLFFNPKKFCGKNFDASYLYYLLSDRFRRQKTYVRDVPYFTSASVIILRIWAKSSFLQIIMRLSFSMTR